MPLYGLPAALVAPVPGRQFATSTVRTPRPRGNWSVVAPGVGLPSGTVQFYKDGAPLGAAKPLAGVSASVTNTFMLVGTYAITATYSGDSNFHGTTGAGQLAAVRIEGATSTTLRGTQVVAVAA